MDEVAGLKDVTAFDVVMGIVYAVTAVVLIATAFILITRKYRVSKLEAVNKLEFITSRYNVYTNNTQFLFKVPFEMPVLLTLLDENRNPIEVLIKEKYGVGEHIYEFDIHKYSNGLFYLQLEADNVDMLRKIKINHA